ncbi:MAG: two-component system response regulator KdpE, partial [Micropepsaceae bacterium]
MLVVEDEPTIRRLICRALEAEGYRAFEAETYKRGLV